MKNDKVIPKNFEEYFSGFPAEVQVKLEELRQTINTSAPGAEEVISYNMPAFRYHGMLVYFAAYKNHIGFYATPTGHAAQFNVQLRNRC